MSKKDTPDLSMALDRTSEFVRMFVAFGDDCLGDLVTFWATHTHVYDRFEEERRA